MNHVSNPCPRWGGGVGGKCMCYATRNEVNFWRKNKPSCKNYRANCSFHENKTLDTY